MVPITDTLRSAYAPATISISQLESVSEKTGESIKQFLREGTWIELANFLSSENAHSVGTIKVVERIAPMTLRDDSGVDYVDWFWSYMVICGAVHD